MEQNHELPSSFQETERCFYVCRSGCGRIAFRHRYSPNALFRAYFLFYQCDAKLQTVQWHGGEYDDSRRTRTDCRIPGRRRGEGRGRDRKSTRLNSSHQIISYAVFCLKKKKNIHELKSRQQIALEQ